MTQPITPATPVNNVITIQPITTAIPSRDSTPQPNPLANLASGTTIEGFVVNRDAQNNPILRTAIGDLRVTSEVFLKTGSEVVFRVDASQASLARILTVDGLSPQNYTAQNAPRGLTQDTISPTMLQPNAAQLLAQAGKPGAPLVAAPILQALILQTHQQVPPLLLSALSIAQKAPTPLLTQLAQLRPGALVALTVLDLKLPPPPIPISSLPNTPKLDQLLPPRPYTTPVTTTNESVPQHEEISAPAVKLNTSYAHVGTPHQTVVKQDAGQQPSPATSFIPSQENRAIESAASPRTAAITTPTTTPAPTTSAAQQAPLPSPSTVQMAMPPSTPTQTNPAIQPTQLRLNTPTTPQMASPTPTSVPTQPSPIQQAPLLQTPQLPYATLQHAATNQPVATENQIIAQVIGHEADGANILHTPFATLKLYTTQPLPTGTSLLVKVKPDTHAPATPTLPPSLTADEQFFSAATRDWKSLDDVLGWLKTNQPDAAREVAQRLPVPGSSKLSSDMLYIMAAIKGGDVNDIIGKRAVRLLEASAPELLSKLRGDAKQIKANLVDSPLSHWSWIALPMLVNGELQQVRLYISKEPPTKDEAPGDQGRGQRFILEVGMSALGPLQFDGFVREAIKTSKSFDLVVRSTQPLDAPISEGIRDIFVSSLQISGMRGQVAFQTGPQHFIKPLAEQKPASGDGYANTILA